MHIIQNVDSASTKTSVRGYSKVSMYAVYKKVSL